MRFMERFKPKDKLKEEISKNKDLMLDVMSESIQGARICPIIQKKCLGKFCEFFLEFNTREGQKYSRCAYVSTPLMILETKLEIEKLQHIILTIAEAAAGVKNATK